MAATTKDAYYWGQLRSALTAGAWASLDPGRAPNAAPLSWSELLRKFNKHCKGFQDVAEIAVHTQSLSLLLTGKKNPTEADLDGESPSPDAPLVLGDECQLSVDRRGEAQKGFEALKALQAGSDTNSLKLALAYYAYSLGELEQCLQYVTEVKDLLDVSSHIPPGSSAPPPPSGGLTIPQGRPGNHSLTSLFGSSENTTTTVTSYSDIGDGRAWSAAEIIRSVCLQGMSLERLHPSDPSKALQSYISALPVISGIATDEPHPAPTANGAGSLDFSAFNRHREVWRWAERLLRRAIILSASNPNLIFSETKNLWELFDRYRACTYPPTFRSKYRVIIFNLHLRALMLKSYHEDDPQTQQPRGLSKPPQWLSTARSIIQEYQTVLNACTYFPKAGSRNQLVEDFVDLCVAVWEASGAIGEHAGWVIDILWWATRLTFNAYRIYRHMTRLACAAGDPDLGVRFLRLYVQIVSRAYEAYSAEGSSASEAIGVSVGLDEDEFDTDSNWVHTCVFGARILCRLALTSQGATGLKQAREAGKMIENARKRLKATEIELAASVDLAEGIWCHVMSIKEQEPATRIERLTACVANLQRSIDVHPTPSAYHHLAVVLSRPGPSHDLSSAMDAARLAVEGDATDVRHWHLLGLLEAADGEWKKARSVFEVASGISDANFTIEEGLGLENPTASTSADGIHTRDFALEKKDTTTTGQIENTAENKDITNTVAKEDMSLLEPGATALPPASKLLLLSSDLPNPSRQELFTHALQLRMSFLALSESVEGPEGVGDYWREVFSWYATRKGPDDTQSVASARTSIRRSVSQNIPLGTGPDHVELAEQPQTLEPIPITFTPATPSHETERHDFPGLEQSFNSLAESTDTASTERESTQSPSAGKKVQQAMKKGVQKSQARITTISRKIGHNVARTGSVHLRRTSSVPDFEKPATHSSSIHARRFYAPSISGRSTTTNTEKAPPPPTPPSMPQPGPIPSGRLNRSLRDRRLLSDLWLMSAATFRRLGKIEQALAAIQEAEVTDEANPAVWVQLALYFQALGNESQSVEALNKALFINPDDVPATIHLCRTLLARVEAAKGKQEDGEVDLAAGMLEQITRGAGWDVPEAWYFLGKAYAAQGRRDRERECLLYALELAEGRGVREIGVAVGWCL